MGCSPSSAAYVHPLQRPSIWRNVLNAEEARRKYVLDGSLPVGAEESLLELREMLDKNFLVEYVAMFEGNKTAFTAYACWEDVRELKSLSGVSRDFKQSKVEAVYQRYLKTGAKHFVQGVPGHVVVEIRAACKAGGLESLAVLDPLQQHCLSVLHREVFLSFRKSKKYEDFLRALRSQYNQVHPNDFVYYRVIGEGTYGVVVHAQKQSTGQHYAVKMLTKAALLEVFRSAPHRVDHEKQALASCCHPFVVSLGYAFQTSSMVFLATSLGRGGTLMGALKACPSHRMAEDRVRFYGAEMVLALAHFHSLGMIFRDLKPDNVLLNADGHIQLVDLGGIVDPDGAVLSADAGIVEDGLFAKDFEGASRLVRNTSFPSANAAAPAPQATVAERAQQRRGSDAEKSVSSQHSIRIHHAPSTTRQVLAVSRNGADQGKEGFEPEREGEDDDCSVSHTRRTRARSIMGTEGFMAIEMRHLQLLKGLEKKCHTGYTNAVDWWSLGATLCFLLSGGYLPCQDTDILAAMDAVEVDAVYRGGMRRIVEATDFSPDRLPADHRAIHDKLTSNPEISMDAVKTIVQLLDFNERTRLGAAGAGGVEAVKQQRFFLPRISAAGAKDLPDHASTKDPAGAAGTTGNPVSRVSSADIFTPLCTVGVGEVGSMASRGYSKSSGGSCDQYGGVTADLGSAQCGQGTGKGSGKHMLGTGFVSFDHFWDACEARQLVPPVIPARSKENAQEPTPYRSFEHLMRKIGKEKWLQNPPPSHLNIYFRKWDFVSPQVVKMEFGISNVMRQYQANAKARLLLGPIGEVPDAHERKAGRVQALWNSLRGHRKSNAAAETDNENSTTTAQTARSFKKK